MTNLLVIVITIILNVSITLFILYRYTFALTKELSETFDDILEATKTTRYATFEVKNKIFNELNKRDKD